MLRIKLAALPLVALPWLLSACASTSGEYPSLARRPAERAATEDVPEPQAAPAPTASATLESQLDRLVTDARAAHRQFEARSGAARSAASVAGSASRGSDAWTSAQVAVSSLEGARSGVMVALAALDRLYADARLAYDTAESPEAARIARARDEVDALAASETQVISGLLRRIGG